MSKKCPNCFETYDDNHAFCSNCGSRLIDDIDPMLNIGDANAISGGININRSNNITSNDTHYHTTTVHERSKSEAELKLEAVNRLRSEAERIIAERGRLDSVAMEQMRPLASQFGIDNETFKSIIRDVRSNRNGSSINLNTANARYLQQAKQAIQTNDFDSLSSLLERLEAMAAISQDEDVQYVYHMTLSFVDPLRSIEIYEKKADENYWRSLWAIVSYINTENYSEATKALTLFNPSRFDKSAEDQILMEALYNLAKNGKDAAQDFLDDIIDGPSPQLAPLHRAIELTTYDGEADNLEVNFYLEHITAQKLSTDNPGLLILAAERGSAEAMYKLAELYSSPDTTKANQQLGFDWLMKAAELDYAEAQDWMGQIYYGCADYGELEIAEDLAAAERYFRKAINNGADDCRISLAWVYERIARRYQLGEDNYRKNHTEALKWFDKAIEADPDYIYMGMTYKSDIYSDPKSREYNMEKAFDCCQTIIMLNEDTNGVFRYKMALWYASGQGCHRDMNKAVELMKEASQLGYPDAELWLENNINDSICGPEAEMNVVFSNLRIINTIGNKINVRGKLLINCAMNKTFDVTVQWNFGTRMGRELLTETTTALYEYTEWADFNFGTFGYHTIAPNSSPDGQHRGECIIRIHEKESGEIIGQAKIACVVEFISPIFGDRKVSCLNYLHNEAN